MKIGAKSTVWRNGRRDGPVVNALALSPFLLSLCLAIVTHSAQAGVEGDYVAGTNHVLPTSRSARFSSGLSVYDFLKRTSFVACSEEGLAKIGPVGETLAKLEGLDAHALSLSLRLRDKT